MWHGEQRLPWQNKEPVSICANNASAFNEAFNILMLMSVKEESRFCPLDVTIESSKPEMDLVVAIMDQSWRVMCQENVNRRKVG